MPGLMIYDGFALIRIFCTYGRTVIKGITRGHSQTSQKMVELRRMEERRREDTRKLRVPEVAVSLSQQRVRLLGFLAMIRSF